MADSALGFGFFGFFDLVASDAPANSREPASPKTRSTRSHAGRWELALSFETLSHVGGVLRFAPGAELA
ncbi:MAG: hypothetical protein L0Y58_00825 [Verrucomicrobia subdivision 3 bacterium]|nr:hypothetical protein [Limisphaerales bacterium]